jgi:hypothetical protein
MLTTGQLAKALGISAQKILNALARTGEFYGVRPTKVGARWQWPNDAAVRLRGLANAHGYYFSRRTPK